MMVGAADLPADGKRLGWEIRASVSVGRLILAEDRERQRLSLKSGGVPMGWRQSGRRRFSSYTGILAAYVVVLIIVSVYGWHSPLLRLVVVAGVVATVVATVLLEVVLRVYRRRYVPMNQPLASAPKTNRRAGS
ncbi:hypothetical protein [Nocardia sp. NBC_01388]|uniref:hypothetical protein n=1 Tax=Nocardia sp. NBC_01388 TaxID=2903596 RepID=UPI00324C4E64